MEDDKVQTKAEIVVAEAFERADSDDATPEDGRRLLALLHEHPGALGFTVDMAESAIDVVIRQMKTSEANRALMHERLERLRKSLGGAEGLSRPGRVSAGRWRSFIPQPACLNHTAASPPDRHHIGRSAPPFRLPSEQ